MFVNCANAFIKEGQYDRAKVMLDRSCEIMRNYPLEGIPVGMSSNDYMVIETIEDYFKIGDTESARALGASLGAQLLVSAQFYLEYYDFAKDDFELAANYILYLTDALRDGGEKEMAGTIEDTLEDLIKAATGGYDSSGDVG